MFAYKVIEKHLLKRSCLSYLLYPFSLFFTIIVLLRRLCYRFLIPVYHAPINVISIGNITAGGNGKTPFTIYIAQSLRDHGYKIAVSHRGYKSNLGEITLIISNENGLLPAADNAGDEAWLLAKRLKGIPVVIGKNRRQAIDLIHATYPDVQCVVLDDSYQHLKVKHDIDFIIFGNTTGIGNGFVLPAGYLREPLNILSKECFYIFNGAEDISSLNKELIPIFNRFTSNAYLGKLAPQGYYNFSGESIDEQIILENTVVLLSAIGNPQGFASTVSNLNVVKHIEYPDHFDYKSSIERQKIIQTAKEVGAKWIITTEKDFAKLRLYPEFMDFLLVLRVDFELIGNKKTVFDYVKAKMSNQGRNI